MILPLDATKLAAGRLWAATRYPYFAAGLFALAPVASPGIGTMAIDPLWRLYVDPAAVEAWTVAQVGSVLVHELGHLLRDHASRGSELGVGAQEAQAWNIACDAEINDDLVDEGLDLPGTPVTPGLFGWANGGLAETYFRQLHSEAGRGNSRDHGLDCGSGAHGRSRPWDDHEETGAVGPAEAELIRRRVAEEVAEHVRRQDAVPAGVRRWADATLRPVVDWRRVLGAEIRRAVRREAGRVDYGYSRPARRSSALPGVILPGMFRPVPEVAVVVDTSGSMDDDDLAGVLGEVDGILVRAGVSSGPVPVIACDSAVGAVTRARKASDVVLAGGGGTDMGVGLELAAGLRPHPHVVVILTDGYTPWPGSAPKATSVVVALIGAAGPNRPPVPGWARVIEVSERAA